MKITPMELHDDPQRLVNTLVNQHSVVLGELHGDIAARLSEVPDRFVDQGDDPRSITVSCTLLETVLYSRRRRQSEASTLKAMRGNGFGIVLVDGKGMRIKVRKHPRTWDGELIEPVPYVPGGEQFSLEEVMGCPLVGGDGVPAPQGYELYVLWYPGSLGLGGAVLAAGILTDKTQLLYASAPLPAAVMEERRVKIGLAGARARVEETVVAEPVKRRRDDDFGDVAADTGQDEGTASPQTS
ncbi:hypothetical protein [Mycobacteroides abscessus]